MEPELRELIDGRIKAGMDWLDANEPGWLDKIDLPKLDMVSGGDCVLGQVFGSWVDALRAQGFSDEHGFLTGDYDEWSNEHGFSVFDLHEQEVWNEDLDESWIQAITKRRLELAGYGA